MNAKYVLRFRRQRSKKTNYKKRLALLKSDLPRVVIRKGSNGMMIQIIEYKEKGDFTVVGASSSELKKFGWKAGTGNIPSAYLTGYLCGLKAKKSKIKKVIVDLGLQSTQKKSRIFAAVKGLKDGGLEIPTQDEIFPSNERIKGIHIEKFASKSKNNFSKKAEISKKISEHFQKVKKSLEEKIK